MALSRAREAALAALVAIEEGSFLGAALKVCDRRAGGDVREIRLARRMVRGVLKTRGRLDWILAQVLITGDPAALDAWTRNGLRLGLYQILYLSSIPSHAAVHETVRLARSRGGEPAARLANGVLRKILREGIPRGVPSFEEDPVGYLAIEESYPPWLVARWVKRLGREKAAERLRAGNRTPPLCVRVLHEGRVDTVVDTLHKEGRKLRRSHLHPSVILLPGGEDPSSLAPFRRREAIVQDEGAALAGQLAQPVSSSARLLDLCAAPGGKILALACGIGPGGRVVAADISPARLVRLKGSISRLGMEHVRIVAADGLALPLRAAFDLVLIDAPCSGLGTLARRADLRWRVSEGDIGRLADLAVRLLRSAADTVEPGGLLIYSTCTTEPEENEEAMARFLKKDSRFRLESAVVPFPHGTLAPDGTLRLLPEVHGCDGTFGARLRRVKD